MTAREQYPLTTKTEFVMNPEQWDRMCNEIDLLRKIVNNQRSLKRADSELISTLTTHADKMRELLEEAALEANASDMWVDNKRGVRYDKAIKAYDEFISHA